MKVFHLSSRTLLLLGLSTIKLLNAVFHIEPQKQDITVVFFSLLLFRSRLRPSLWPRPPHQLQLRCRWFPLGRRQRRWSNRRSSSSRWWPPPPRRRSRRLLPTAPPSSPRPRLQSLLHSNQLSPNNPPRVKLDRAASEPRLLPSPAARRVTLRKLDLSVGFFAVHFTVQLCWSILLHLTAAEGGVRRSSTSETKPDLKS